MSETNKQRNKDRQTQPHKSYNLLEGFLGFRALGGLGFTGFDAHTRTKAGKAPHSLGGFRVLGACKDCPHVGNCQNHCLLREPYIALR